MASGGQEPSGSGWNAPQLAALLGGNAALALGPWWVRLADTGPVSSGFWRLFLALPLLALLAGARRQPLGGLPRATLWAMAGAGAFFGLDIASWHVGIEQTRLGNAALFGNSGSIVVMAWGLVALRRAPRPAEWLAFLFAIGGAAILMGRSLEVDARSLAGDLLCLLAGLFYAFYIVLLQNARARLGSWSLLTWSSLASVPVLLAIALLRAEPFWPEVWWPVIGLALGSQVLGQGLLVYAMRHFSPLVIGLALLTQPAIAVVAGWFAFGERLGIWDAVGMLFVGLALALARGSDRP